MAQSLVPAQVLTPMQWILASSAVAAEGARAAGPDRARAKAAEAIAVPDLVACFIVKLLFLYDGLQSDHRAECLSRATKLIVTPRQFGGASPLDVPDGAVTSETGHKGPARAALKPVDEEGDRRGEDHDEDENVDRDEVTEAEQGHVSHGGAPDGRQRKGHAHAEDRHRDLGQEGDVEDDAEHGRQKHAFVAEEGRDEAEDGQAGAGGGEGVALAGLNGFGAAQPEDPWRQRQGQGRDQGRARRRDDGDDEEGPVEGREGRQGLGQEEQEGGGPCSEGRGERAGGHADAERQDGHGKREPDAVAQAEDDARHEIPPEGVGSEKVGVVGRLVGLAHDLRLAEGGDQGREGRHEQDGERDGQGDGDGETGRGADGVGMGGGVMEGGFPK